MKSVAYSVSSFWATVVMKSDPSSNRLIIKAFY